MDHPQKVNLAAKISDRYSDGELRELALQLGVEYDELPPGGKRDKAREFVLHLERRSQLPLLVETLKQDRPNEDWAALSGAVHYADEATYRAQVARMNRELEFVGIPELKERRAITVADIFVRLQVEREAERMDVELLEAYRRAETSGDEAALADVRLPRHRIVHAGPSVLGVEDRLRQAEPSVILGDPGSGKTTLLRFLAVLCAEPDAADEATKAWLRPLYTGDQPPLPIFVRLREFAAESAQRQTDYDLLDYLCTHAREHLTVTLPRDFFEQALRAGRCLVCLDGLDEIWAVGQRARVRDAVRSLVARFGGHRFLVTSRIVGYEEAPLDRREWAHHTVLPLRDEEIRDFVRRWYDAREPDPVRRQKQTDDLIATIERQPRIQTLARNPLLLTIIALVHRIEAELPHERVKLYDKCVTALVDTWDEVKGLTDEDKQRPFFRAKRRLLEQLAFHLHTEAAEPGREQTIQEGDLELLLTRFLMDDPELDFAGKPNAARDEARAFIWLAKARTGLLVERGDGIFAFPHLTFQEYLAARDIERRAIWGGVDELWQAIQPHLMDPHWREVILLLLGSLNQYARLPTLLVERILQAGTSDPFEPVLHRQLFLAARVLADQVKLAPTLNRLIVDQLLSVIRHGEYWESDDALDALAWLLERDSYSTRALLQLAQDAQVSTGLRIATTQKLSLVTGIEALNVLINLIQDQESNDLVRRSAIYVLGEITVAQEAKELLLKLVDISSNPAVRRAAAQALGSMGFVEVAAQVLLSLAANVKIDIMTRTSAVMALGKFRCEDMSTSEALLELMQKEMENPGLSLAIIQALGEFEYNEKIVQGMVALVQNTKLDEVVRLVAVQTLSQMSHTDKAVGQHLLSLAQNNQMAVRVRLVTAQALGGLGWTEEAGEVLLGLLEELQSEESTIRDIAQLLSQIGFVEKAVEILSELAQTKGIQAGVRRAAAQTLSDLGYISKAKEVFLKLASDKQVDAGIRRAAAQSLVDLGDNLIAVSVFQQLAEDAQVEVGVRRAAAQVLGQLKYTEEAKKILLELATDEQVYQGSRRAAAQALGMLGYKKEAGEILAKLANNEQWDSELRRTAAEALGELGQQLQAGEILLKLVQDEQIEESVRQNAYESLKRLVGVQT